MQTEKLSSKLNRLRREELEEISERAFGDRQSAAKNKRALVKILMQRPVEVAQALQEIEDQRQNSIDPQNDSLDNRGLTKMKNSWWARYHNHVYGGATLIGVAIAIVAYYSQPGSVPATSPIDRLRWQRVIDQVERVRSTPPEILTAAVETRINVEAVPNPTTSGFELIDHSVVCDLRNFRQLPSVDHAKMLSPVVQRIRQRVKNTGDDLTYRLRTHTSGIDVFSRSTSHPLKVYASEERRTVAKYPVKPRILEFDVSAEPKNHEFTIDVSKTFWNAFQNLDQSWVGITVELPTRSISYLVVFPDDRPYRAIEHFVNDENRNRINLPEEDYVIEDTQKRWIWWNIVNPKPQHGYNIDWEW